MTSADVHVLIKIISWRCSTHVQKQNKNKIHKEIKEYIHQELLFLLRKGTLIYVAIAV